MGTLFSHEKAQGLVEYALILMLIALGVIAGLSFLGGGIVNSIYNNILAKL